MASVYVYKFQDTYKRFSRPEDVDENRFNACIKFKDDNDRKMYMDFVRDLSIAKEADLAVSNFAQSGIVTIDDFIKIRIRLMDNVPRKWAGVGKRNPST